ncbi:hypothetical protein, partial [Lelliottia sp. CFBP8978]|uniref:hypothetical protein n=1 Tax=Lelliottia sp. CFBP8978 TaxID=3096522 RepID=UPI002A6A1693
QTAVEWLVSVLANTKLTTFTAVFYWFTLNRDEPFFCPAALRLHGPTIFVGSATRHFQLFPLMQKTLPILVGN